MENKEFWKSKTLWANLIAVIALVLNAIWGFDLDAEAQATIATGILAVVNVVLRIFTSQPLKK